MSLAVLALVLTAGPVEARADAAAQVLSWTASARDRLPEVARALREAKVGEWVTYRLEGGQVGPGFMRLAVVGEEEAGYWLEVETGEHPSLAAPLLQLRLLVDRGGGLRREGIRRLIVAIGHERPTEVALEALSRALARPAAGKATAPRSAHDVQVSRGSSARVMTAAGSVSAVPVEVRYRATVVQRFWLADSVPLLRLAKLELPALRHVFEVHAYGDGAQPRMILPAPNSPRIRLDATEEAP